MGLIDLARQGRNGDTVVAHLTPGEMVVPREVAAMRPDLAAHISRTIAGYGVDPARYVVGSGGVQRNPATGMQEFASDQEISEAYQSQLGRAATQADLDYWSNPANGFSLDAGSNFMNGVDYENAQKASAGTPAPAPSYGDYGSNSSAPPTPAQAAQTAAAGTGSAMGGTGATGGSAGPGGSGTTGSSTPAPAVDWSTIYENVAGRNASTQDLAYWNNQSATLGNDAAYKSFLTGVQANGEIYNPDLSYADASKPYAGYASGDTTSNVDEWALNNFGRNATADEMARYGGATTPAQAQQNYGDFIANAGQPGKNLDLFQASQLIPPAANAPANLTYQPNLYQGVDANETIQGQLAGILAQDANGNYTNDVVRQAVERAQQQFAARGLLNTSMAAQAGQEAAIAKAIDIAGPDAQAYFNQARANQDAQNTFANNEVNQVYTQANNQAQYAHDDATLASQQSQNDRANYITALNNAQDRHNTAIANIQNSQMTPDAKDVAIRNENASYEGQLVMANSTFSKMPGWQGQWLTAAVPTASLDVNAVNDYNTLYDIINDPAQPPALQAKARERLALLARQAAAQDGSSGGGGGTAASPAPQVDPGG